MNKVLHLLSSVNTHSSTSREIGGLLVEKLKLAQPAASFIQRDLTVHAPPHISPEFLFSLGTPEAEVLAASREYLTELKDADLLVIEAAMYNFTIPSTLKAWFDHIVRAGHTFQMTANGPEGLLKNTKAILVLGSGWIYSEGPAKARDHQEPYLRTILGYIGITDVETIRIEGTALGEELKQSALQRARARVAEVVETYDVRT
ncbi:FMN-dependent NADH-azoreductase [Roseimicrobium gellanilyticum]|uniref:FMN dependent NADH:quinone oxidoreductase n=1 Tax=Roseimicrobium gellanilyticum TaxID=748857 RepID=A0A366HGE3_9BACT|nr:NAD(P)H-dependent oxidoreductase [Roseimicrobium gellanilyticum]RBP40528.1 FMN-dependent NADH-azoreductase [Roseimicrobium gellanilyticum]